MRSARCNAIYTAIDIVCNRTACRSRTSCRRAEREKSSRDTTVKEPPQAAARSNQERGAEAPAPPPGSNEGGVVAVPIAGRLRAANE